MISPFPFRKGMGVMLSVKYSKPFVVSPVNR